MQASMSEIAIWEQMNGMGQDRMRQVMRLTGWETIHEQQMRTGDTDPNGHEQYFPFILGHLSVISD
jgi:hypothetical protein